MTNISDFKNFWKDKTVLITGHTGFKGSWMSLFLSLLGANVIGLSNNDSMKSRVYSKKFFRKYLKAEFFFDISNQEQNKFKKLNKFNIEYVFHFAAQSLVSYAKSDPYITYKTNVLGTLNLIEYLDNIDRKIYLVVATTDKVYCNPEDINTEDYPLGGFEYYGSSKVSVEKLIDNYLDLNSNSKLKITKIRCGNVLGGGEGRESRLLTDLVYAIESNTTFHVRNPKSIRPWIHVLDALYGYCLSAIYLKETEKNEVFNLSNSRKEYDVEKLIKSIIKKWNVDLDIKTVPVKEFNEADVLRINSKKANEIIKWNPKVEFEEIINLIVEWEVQKNKIGIEKITTIQINNYLNKIN